MSQSASLKYDDAIRIGKYDFHFVCVIEPERNVDGTIREHMPQTRYNNVAGWALHQYGGGPFCKFKIPRNLNCSGVYALCVDREIRYIGECEKLSQRFNAGYGNISPRNCFKGGQQTNCRINNLVFQEIKRGVPISLWFLAIEDYKLLERRFRDSLSLGWNRV